jgi:hypothetical protein
MKTIALTIAFSIIFFTAQTYASTQELDFNLEDETYVDDIPFNTKKIVEKIAGFYDSVHLLVENIDTKYEVAINTLSASSIEFTMEDEEYIDDIPFNTEEVYTALASSEIFKKEYIIQEFALAEEDYINDIPFDTRQIIMDRIQYPDFARETGLEGHVSVSVRYDENGYLHVVDYNYSDSELKDYILSVLENIRLRSGIVSSDKEYILEFNFSSI